MTRPTVPTTTWAPCFSWAIWLRIGAPPKTATTWTPRCSPYARSAWVTWMQSARVEALVEDPPSRHLEHGIHPPAVVRFDQRCRQVFCVHVDGDVRAELEG